MKRRKIFVVILFITTSLFASGFHEDTEVLNIYSIIPLNISQPIFSDFSKEKDVKVNIKKVTQDELFQILVNDNSECWGDIIFGGPVIFYKDISENDIFFSQLTLTRNMNLKSYVSPEGLWAFLGINPTVFLSNTSYLKDKGLKSPNSWLDFIYPSYKNNLVLSGPRHFGNMELIFSLTAIYGVNGEKKIQEKIVDNIDDNKKYKESVAKIVAEEKASFGITDLVDAISVIKDGADITLSFPKEGETYGISCIGILKNGSNLHNSMSFYRWMESNNYKKSLKRNKSPYIPVDSIYSYNSPYFDFSKVKLLETDLTWKVATKENFIKSTMD